MKNRNSDHAANLDKGVNMTSRNRFNRRIFNRLLKDESLTKETSLLYDASQIVNHQLGGNEWMPSARDVIERMEDESDEDFEKRIKASCSYDIVNRVIIPMDSSKTAQTLHALAVADDSSALGVFERPSIGKRISIEDEISDKLEEQIDRAVFLDVEDTSTGKSYRVPFNLITIGGAGGLGKTGIDIKLTSVMALANIMDTLDIAKRIVDGKMDIYDVPAYFIHRLGRLMSISSGIGSSMGKDISKMDSLLIYLLAQSSYVHLEEPSKDAENIAIPRSKGKKILMSDISSSLAGTTVDSLTSIFFAVSGGAMQGGWNPSEAKALLAKLDKFSSRYSHPIISVINYLKFNADGQKGIASICQSMSSMHIDLGVKRILLRTETDKRPAVGGDLLIKGITIRITDRDKLEFDSISDYAEKDIPGVEYLQLDLVNNNIDDQLSAITGTDITLPVTVDIQLQKTVKGVDHPLLIVLDHKRETPNIDINDGDDVVKHIDVENSLRDNTGEDVYISNQEVKSVVTKTEVGSSKVTPFLSSIYAQSNTRSKGYIEDNTPHQLDGDDILKGMMSEEEKRLGRDLAQWSLLSDKQLIIRAAKVVNLISLSDYGNDEITKAKIIYQECLREYISRGYKLEEFETAVNLFSKNN